MASFNTLPPELREMIYDLVFTTSSPALDSSLLLNRVPGSLSLRLTNRFTANESHRSYLKASKHYDTIRATLIDTIVTHYESTTTPIHTYGIDPSQAGAINLHNIALSLCHPNSRCKNACASQGCYMCPDPAHQSCFDCGRNLAMALYCKMSSAHAAEAPHLIQPCSDGRATALGAWLGQFPRNHAIARRAECTYAMYVPDADSCTGFRQAERLKDAKEVTARVPWAFTWWKTESHRQYFVDVRCGIRRRAVQAHYQQRNAVRLTESWVQNLERCDPRLPHVLKIGKHFAVKGVMEWKGEYKRRVEQECAVRGWDARGLIPAYDQEKDARTCRDAEWFP